MHVAIPLGVVVFVADPFAESAAALTGDDVQTGAAVGFLEAVDAPLAEVRGVITGLIKRLGDGGHAVRQGIFMAGHGMVRITPGEHRTATRRAERTTADRAVKPKAFGGQAINVGRMKIGVADAVNGDQRGRGCPP
ncbi:MAG: hypothetical protein WC058_11040 [Phycisphaeraceae bacterium]